MRMKILTIFLFVMLQLHAQNKISVFFESNKHKTHDKGLLDIKEFIRNNFEYIDSITFIAYTDTVGSEEKNKKLAQKRLEFVESYIDKNLTYKAKRLVRGETQKYKFERNRRVDLIIYSSLKEKVEPDSSIEDFNYCHKINYHLLSICSFKKIKLGKHEYMQIETQFLSKFNKIDLFFILNPEDSVKRLAPVVWKNKMTGKDWWVKKRQVALIPFKSFEHSKIFSLEAGPCNSCHCNSDNPKKDSILVHSEMINQNLQYKQTLFNKNTLKVRIPSQFVDPLTVYYKDRFQKVNWDKSKNKDYFYCKIKHFNSDFSSIIFFHFAENCSLPKSEKHPKCRNRMQGWMCGGVHDKRQPFNLKIEIGYFFKAKTHVAYAAVQAYDLKLIEKRLEIHGLLGAMYNSQINYYFSQSFKYRLIKLDLYPLSDYSEWQSNKIIHPTYKRLQVFLGSDLMNNVEKENKSILNYTYLEMRYQNDDARFFNSFFVRYGIGQTFLKKTHDVQKMFQFGILHDLHL
jgi:hypothetical protein